jgi:pimeloyl-ACP methyl ester carboxylesterase
MGFVWFLHILAHYIAFFSDCIVRRLMSSSSSSSMMDNSSNATCSSTNFSRGLVETPLGMLHYKYTGSLPTASSSMFNDNDSAAPNNNNNKTKTLLPILCFHMSPRSTDEYTEVMPLLSNPPAWLLPVPGACRGRHVDARHRRLTEAAFTSTTAESSRHERQRQQQRLVVAIDEPGYGDSDNPRRSCTLDDIADAYIHVATHLGIQNFIVAGSLMGCYIALSLASSRQHVKNRVKAIICTNLYYYPHEKHVEAVQQEQEQQQDQQQQQQQQPQNDQQQQQQQQPFPAIADSWEIHEDGSHLMSLWNQRSSWLNAELNSRVVHDELTYLLKRRRRYAQGGIHIQSGAAFDLACAAQNVTCPVLIVMGAGAMQFFDAIGKCMTSQLELAKQLFPTMPLQVVIGGGDGDGEQTHEGSINLLNQNHQEWTRAVLQFLEDEVEKY